MAGADEAAAIEAEDKIITDTFELLKHNPPSLTEAHRATVIQLQPDVEQRLLEIVDVPAKVLRCPSTGRDFLTCGYNIDLNTGSHRSPWSNTFVPAVELSDADAAELIPQGHVRRMEESLNLAIDVYRELYYEGGHSSAYMWHYEDESGSWLNCAVVFKNAPKQAAASVQGEWNAIHVFVIEEAATRRSATYQVNSTVLLDMASGDAMALKLEGHMTLKVERTLPIAGLREADLERSHVVNIGSLVEEIESDIRNQLQHRNFSKLRSSVGDLRSVQPLSEAARDRKAHREVIDKMTR